MMCADGAVTAGSACQEPEAEVDLAGCTTRTGATQERIATSAARDKPNSVATARDSD